MLPRRDEGATRFLVKDEPATGCVDNHVRALLPIESSLLDVAGLRARCLSGHARLRRAPPRPPETPPPPAPPPATVKASTVESAPVESPAIVKASTVEPPPDRRPFRAGGRAQRPNGSDP